MRRYNETNSVAIQLFEMYSHTRVKRTYVSCQRACTSYARLFTSNDNYICIAYDTHTHARARVGIYDVCKTGSSSCARVGTAIERTPAVRGRGKIKWKKRTQYVYIKRLAAVVNYTFYTIARRIRRPADDRHLTDRRADPSTPPPPPQRRACVRARRSLTD